MDRSKGVSTVQDVLAQRSIPGLEKRASAAEKWGLFALEVCGYWISTWLQEYLLTSDRK